MTQEKGQREVGFELLRVLAMLGVVVNHFFNHALNIYNLDGSEFQVTAFSIGDDIAWVLLEAVKLVALVSVDCYVLTTGYFMIGKTELRSRGIAKVWSETFFYSAGIWLLFLALGHAFSLGEMLQCCLPMIHNNYWFITNYLFLMLVAPYLSRMASTLSKSQYRNLLIVGAIICFQYPFGRILLSSQQFLLFIYLYLVGGYIRRHVDRQMRTKEPALLFILLLLVMLSIALAKNMVYYPTSFHIFSMDYSGLVMPLAVAVFLIFRNLTLPRWLHRPVMAVAPLSLSVYLIHEHPLVHGLLWDAARHYVEGHSYWRVLADVFVVCLSIYCLCLPIDALRHAIARRVKSPFERWLR